MGRPLSLLLIEIDNLGMVNDNFGGLAGDTVLHEVAAEIRRCVRDIDICGRYGSGTFLVMLRAGVLDSKLVAERIRGAVERRAIPGLPMPVTVSIGVACAMSKTPTPAMLIGAADKVLRQAMENGPNQVEKVLL